MRLLYFMYLTLAYQLGDARALNFPECLRCLRWSVIGSRESSTKRRCKCIQVFSIICYSPAECSCHFGILIARALPQPTWQPFPCEQFSAPFSSFFPLSLDLRSRIPHPPPWLQIRNSHPNSTVPSQPATQNASLVTPSLPSHSLAT